MVEVSGMSNYNATRAMVESVTLGQRVTASVAEKGVASPEQWARDQMWFLAADDEWVARWADADFNYNPTYNPDTGARPDVITDAIIDRAVQERMDYLASFDPTGAQLMAKPDMPPEPQPEPEPEEPPHPDHSLPEPEGPHPDQTLPGEL